MQREIKDGEQTESQQKQEGTERPESAAAAVMQILTPPLEQHEEVNRTSEPLYIAQEFHKNEDGTSKSGQS